MLRLILFRRIGCFLDCSECPCCTVCAGVVKWPLRGISLQKAVALFYLLGRLSARIFSSSVGSRHDFAGGNGALFWIPVCLIILSSRRNLLSLVILFY